MGNGRLPNNRVMVLIERASLRDRWEAHMRHQTSRAALRLAQAPLCSIVIGWDWIVIDLDRSVTGPGSTVTHEVSQRESPPKRPPELRETCHSKAVFHSTAVKYLRHFVILALQLERNALCERAADGVVTEGLVKFSPQENENNPNVPAADQQLNNSDIGFCALHKPQSHTHVWLWRDALYVAFRQSTFQTNKKLKSPFSCFFYKAQVAPLYHEFKIKSYLTYLDFP